MTVSNEFLEKTIKIWQPHYKEKLTLEDAREIVENSYSLIKLLDKLDRKYSNNKEAVW